MSDILSLQELSHVLVNMYIYFPITLRTRRIYQCNIQNNRNSSTPLSICIYDASAAPLLLLSSHFNNVSFLLFIRLLIGQRDLSLRGYIATSCFGVCSTLIDSLCVRLHVDKIILKYQCFLFCVCVFFNLRQNKKEKQHL